MVFSKVVTVSQLRFVGSAITRLGAIGLAACLLMTGCGKTEQVTTAVDTSAEGKSSEQVIAETEVANNELLAEQGEGEIEVAPEQTTPGSPRTPVSYDVRNWQADNKEDLSLDDLNQIKNKFGKVIVTDENSLDYASNSAVKYRFARGDQPYLDIIDSDAYLEIGWYYANPDDSDSEKQISVDHAKKAYQVATALMGDEGGRLVANMLAGQVVKHKTIEEMQVELAKCEFYSCMLVFNKNS
ncbi:hypothetical protein [Psychrobacter lutiphocae]|uniref:hypothetical protein n=1 Tax=Psychrobacter lutiphocae TaxID=540500 RepID=UPI000365EC20|nr:hypothetical protein [Psychrobacter lutiphocae]